MNWTRILVTGLASGLAVGLAELLLRGKTRGAAYWLTVFASITLMNALTQNVILPEIDAWQATLNFPVLAALEKLDPVAAEQVRGFIREASKTGDKSGENKAKIRSAIAAATKKHAFKASDEALVMLFEVILDQADRVKSNPEMCYRLFFPEPSRFVDYSKVFDQTLLNREQKALESVLRTAAENPQRTVPTEADVSDALTTLEKNLTKRRGLKEDDLQLLANPTAPGADRGKVCATFITMFREILSLPKDRGPLLRFMFAES